MMTEKIFVSIDDERFEATGDLLEEIKQRNAEIAAFKAEQERLAKEKAERRKSALSKLSNIGLDEEDLIALGL